MHYFIDESGNTGTDWLNEEQPYFVYGGWLINDSQCVLAEKRFKEIFSFSKAREIKSKSIFPGKQKYFYDFYMCFTEEINAVPAFIIADKKYMIAAKIIETFFDCAYNPYVNEYLTGITPLKKALADYVSKKDQLLIDFEKIITSKGIDIESMRGFRDKLAECFDKNELRFVMDVISRLSDDSLDQMIEEYRFLSDSWTDRKRMALTQPILFQLLTNISGMESVYNEKIKVCADELFGYENVINELEQICLRGRLIQNVTKIELCNSKSKPLIQAADLLCGYIARMLRDIDTVSLDKNDIEIWNKLCALHDTLAEMNIVEQWCLSP